MLHEIISNTIAITVGMAMVSMLQMRRAKAGSLRIEQAAEHFEAANDAHDAYLAKVRENTVETLSRLRQATYMAETATGLDRSLRLDPAVPEEITSMPRLAPRTPAQRAKAKRRAR